MSNRSIITMLLLASLVIIFIFLGLLLTYRNNLASTFENSEVGILEIEGIILDSKDVLKKIRMLKERDSVMAVVVRVNSPGGAIAPSQEIYEALKRLDKVKPVVSSFGSLAASGGYYVACGSRTIFANGGSLTGSIGVIMQLTYLEKLYEFIKVTPIIIKSGKYKDIGASNRKMTLDERLLLQRLSDDMHMQFKKAVSESRKIPMKVLENFADGRVFSGIQAYEFGLVDQIGTIDDAIKYAAGTVGYLGEPKLFYPKEPRETLRELFSGVESFITNIMSEVLARFPVVM